MSEKCGLGAPNGEPCEKPAGHTRKTKRSNRAKRLHATASGRTFTTTHKAGQVAWETLTDDYYTDGEWQAYGCKGF